MPPAGGWVLVSFETLGFYRVFCRKVCVFGGFSLGFFLVFCSKDWWLLCSNSECLNIFYLCGCQSLSSGMWIQEIDRVLVF